MNERPGRERPRAVIERDAALARIGRTRRWVLVGTAALTAGAAGLVSAIAPGRSLGAKPAGASESAVSTTAATSSHTAARAYAPQMPPLANPSSLGLSGPSQPPSASTTDNSAATPPAPAQSAASQAQSNAAQSQAAPAPVPAPVPQPSVVSGGS
jgi:hypothetical protein